MGDTTSAVPANLASFTADGKRLRAPLEATQSSLTGLQKQVLAASPDYGVAGSTLPSVASTLQVMAYNEAFVSTIHDALVQADHTASGSVTISNASVAAALAAAGNLGTKPPVITAGSTQLYGKPPTSGFVDDPICAANGNFVHDDVDLAFPGWAAVLDVVRVYNSLAVGTVGAFGPGWSSVLDLRLEPAGDGVVWAHLADGAIVAFVAGPGENDYRVVGPRRLRLSGSPDGGWTLHEGHVKHWTFDRNGTFTGGTAGAATLIVERDAVGRAVRLAETRSGRWVQCTWTGDRVTAVTSNDGRRAEHRYDAAGALVAVDRPAGALRFKVDDALIVDITDADDVRLVHNVYDDTGRVIEQTNELGRTTRYSYSDQGTTLVSDTVDGPTNAFTHDPRGNLTAMVDGFGRALRLTYDQADRVTRVVDRTGAVTTHTFDERGNLTGRIDPDGLGQEWEWDDQNRLIAETHRNGARTTYDYDGDHRRPTRIIGPDGATTTVRLAETGLPVEIVDADGVATRFEHDDDGQMTASTDGLGRRSTVRYDAAGQPIELTDAAGGATTLVNDDAGRVVESLIGDDVIRYAYSAAGRPLSGVDAVGQSWSATYGTNGHLGSLTDGEGSTVRFDWSLFGNLDTVTAPDGARYRHEYDAANNLVAAIDPAGNVNTLERDGEARIVAATDPAGREWRRELDVLGRTTVSIAPDGARTRYEYGPLSLVTRVVHPDGHSVSAEYDDYGRAIAIVDELGARYEVGYSPAGRLVERRWPSGRTERFTYDAAGHLASADIAGEHTECRTDGLGRLLSADTPNGRLDVEVSGTGEFVGLSGPSGSERYELDAAGRLTGLIDGTGGRTSLNWDTRGQVTSATDASGLTTLIGYDVRGRDASMTSPGGDTFSYAYDAVGWTTTYTDPLGTTTNRRDPSGRIVGIDRPGSTTIDIDLDPVGRVAGISSNGRLDRHFSYDERGRLSEAIRVADNLRTSFGWDPVGRLRAVNGFNGELIAQRDVDGLVSGWIQNGIHVGVQRDARGAVTTFDDPVLGEVDAPAALDVARDRAGRITSDGLGNTFRYDDAGRLVEALDPSGTRRDFRYEADGLLSSELAPDGETFFYRRGFLGRVETVVHPDSTETEFSYDARGRRVERRTPDGTVTRYVWDSYDRLTGIEHDHGDGRVERHRFMHDALGRPIAIDDRPILWDDVRTGRPLQIGASRYLHLDGRHRVAESDSAWNQPLADPWGVETDTGETPHVGYRGELAALDLVWMGARVYDPATREFLTPDPLLATPGRPGAASVYSYSFCDPVNFLDPAGLKPVSQAQWDAMRKQEEEGRLGQAWDAIQHDPWGTLAMVGVTAVGVGLCVTGVGTAVGAGILVGVGMGAAQGLISGNFDPKAVAVSGAVGAIPGGSTFKSAMLVGSVSGAGSDTALQLWEHGSVNVGEVAESAAFGAGGGAITHGLVHSTPIDEAAPPTTPRELPAAPARLALPAPPERLALPAAPERLALPAAPERLALPAGNPLHSPDFIVHPNGEAVPVPTGAVGPTAVESGRGFQFTGGSGGHGLDPRVSAVRVMDPVTTGKYPHPNGYVSYSNSIRQTVNPWTGQTVSRSDPTWHMDWSSP